MTEGLPIVNSPWALATDYKTVKEPPDTTAPMISLDATSRTSAVVHAVIVTFNPDPDRLIGLVKKISPQVQCVIIVDNASKIDPAATLSRLHTEWNPDFIRLDQNHGIGFAQNVGLRAVTENGADFAIVFDHDSDPSHDLVANLLLAYQIKCSEGYKVAAIGPRFIDERNSTLMSFVKIKGICLCKLPCPNETSVLEVDHLISSGSLVPISSLQKIGYMREDLFIDYVDIEWCLRARHAGYRCFGACNATMAHNLGEAPITHLGRIHTNHSPLRQYYLFRNRIFLYKQGWIPLRWKIADGVRLLLRYCFYTSLIFSKPRHWKMMHLGLLDGVFSRLGKLTKSP